jgi:hypothetical protein
MIRAPIEWPITTAGASQTISMSSAASFAMSPIDHGPG